MNIIQKERSNTVTVSIFGIAVIVFSFIYLKGKNNTIDEHYFLFSSLALVGILLCCYAMIACFFMKSEMKVSKLKSLSTSAMAIWILICLFVKL